MVDRLTQQEGNSAKMARNNEKLKALARKNLFVAQVSDPCNNFSGSDVTKSEHKTPLEMLSDFRSKMVPEVTYGDSPDELVDDIQKWPALSRYMVAELERFGIDRDAAIEAARRIAHNCLNCGAKRMEVSR